MARIDDGGDFGGDPMLRLLAKLKSGSLSADDIREKEQLAQDGVNTGIGVAGTIRNVSPGIRVVPSAYDLEQEAYKRAAENAPNYFEKFGPKAVTVPGQEAPISVEQFKKLKSLFSGGQ